MFRIGSIFLTCVLLFPTLTYGNELNAGFVQGLWYSSPTVFVQEQTRIYVALRNNTDHDLTGTVKFTDNGDKIGASSVSALPGRIVEAWVDWIPTYGSHAIVATISDVKVYVIGAGVEQAEIDSTLAEDMLFVDYDSDNDKVGNDLDTDDDNDGVSDTTEKQNGTNPVVPDTKEEPKKVSVAPVQNAPEEEQDIPNTQIANTNERGLEKYVATGTIDTLFKNATSKVTEAKESLDTYRTARDEATRTSLTAANDSAMETVVGISELPSTTNPTELATITRSKIERTQTNFLEALIDGTQAFITGLYSLLLLSLSHVLGHPALLELALLIGILYICYRIARKLGRRPGNRD